MILERLEADLAALLTALGDMAPRSARERQTYAQICDALRRIQARIEPFYALRRAKTRADEEASYYCVN